MDLPWQPGGARGATRDKLPHGAQFLVCVRLAGTLTGGVPWLDWHVCEVQNDDDGFVLHNDGTWKWRWEDIEWILPMACLSPPC